MKKNTIPKKSSQALQYRSKTTPNFDHNNLNVWENQTKWKISFLFFFTNVITGKSLAYVRQHVSKTNPITSSNEWENQGIWNKMWKNVPGTIYTIIRNETEALHLGQNFSKSVVKPKIFEWNMEVKDFLLWNLSCSARVKKYPKYWSKLFQRWENVALLFVLETCVKNVLKRNHLGKFQNKLNQNCLNQ